MKKNKINLLFILLVFISAPLYRAQNLYFTPTIGVKADINRNSLDYTSDYYFKFSSTKFKSTGLSPLLFGFNLEYKKDKNIYGLGLIVGDQANSETKVAFHQTFNDPYFTNGGDNEY